MDRFKEQISRRVQQLGESFSAEDDVKVLLDDMSEFMISSYDAPGTSSELVNDVSSQNSTPKKKPVSKLSEEEEIINSIDAAYFIDNDEFEAIDYELKKLCDIEMCYEDIQRERLRLKAQHTVVSKKISSLIMQKSPSYGGQIGDMESIKGELANVISNIVNIRRSLALAKTQTKTCLGLIANEKKKTMLKNLKNTLDTIKTFHKTEQHIRETIEDGKFPLAIQMLIETQILATRYVHFTCVNDVMTKLAGISNLLETELDSQLSIISVVYNHEKYIYVYTAFEMLDKTSKVPEKLQAAFLSAIDSTSRAIVLDKLTVSDEEATYISLCLKLDNDQSVVVLREMGFVLCRTFHSFHLILKYHQAQDSISEKEVSQPAIFTALMQCLPNLFSAAVSKIMVLIESREFISLKFDQILDIVDMMNRFKKVGIKYFGYYSKELVESIENRISSYFERYHRERLEELAMFIENESFTLCPVPCQFTIFDLQDFEFLKESRQELDDNDEFKKEYEERNEIELMSNDWQNPFSQAVIKSRLQSTYSQKSGGTGNRSFSTNSDGHTQAELVDDSFCEDPLDDNVLKSQQSPNICNTALNLLRFFGRYIRMTALLPTLCDRSAPAIMELYEFFLASMCHIFVNTGAEFVVRSNKLANCLENITKKLTESTTNASSSSAFKNVFRQSKGDNLYPSICPTVQIAFIDNLYGACERIIAIDSIEFVAKQLDLIRPVIESLIADDVNEDLHSKLEYFYTQVLSCTSDAKTLIVDTSASRSLRLKTLVSSVSSVKWDINELKSQHNAYVDFLIQDFQVFSLRLNALNEGVINLTDSTKKLFWQRTIFYAFKALVAGYGDGGKCSTEGRALMQLDFQNILMKLEVLCEMKPVPHASFVDGYIKAYYLPENGLEQFIKSHSEYSSKQLTSLLGAAAHVSKKARTRIQEALKTHSL